MVQQKLVFTEKTNKDDGAHQEKSIAPKLKFNYSEKWQLNVKIGDLTKNVIAGATPRTSNIEYWENGTIPWLSSGEIHKKHIEFTDKFITKSGYDNSSTKMIPEHSVLIALAGQGKTRGTVAINNIELCTNQSVASIIPNEEKLYYKYLFYYLENQYDKLRALSSSDGGRGGLNLKLIKSFKINLPSIDEQKKIANFISQIDNKIELLEKKLFFYQKFDSHVKTNIFSEKLKFYPDEEWEEKKIEKLVTEHKEKAGNEKYPILSSTLGGIVLQEEYFDKNVNSDDTTNYKIVPKGFFTYRSMSDTGIFRFNIQNLVEKGIVSPAYPVFDVINVDKLFFEEYLNNSIKIKKQILTLKEGGTRYALSFSKFKKLKVSIPSENEQQKISQFLKYSNLYIKHMEDSIVDLKKFKKGLLQKMFI